MSVRLSPSVRATIADTDVVGVGVEGGGGGGPAGGEGGGEGVGL